MPARIEVSDDNRRAIERFYGENLLYATEVARRLGLSHQTVKRVIHELGIESRGTSKPIPVGMEFNNGRLRVTALADPTVRKNGYQITNVWVHCKCNGPNSNFMAAAELLRCGNIGSCGCLNFGSPNYRPRPDREWGRVLRQYMNNYPDFSLSLPQVKHICSQACFYCGCPPSNELKGRRYRGSTGKVVMLYSGIDEVVNGGGHVVGNILPCCIMCNMAKSDMTLEEWCQYAHKDVQVVLAAAQKWFQMV